MRRRFLIPLLILLWLVVCLFLKPGALVVWVASSAAGLVLLAWLVIAAWLAKKITPGLRPDEDSASYDERLHSMGLRFVWPGLFVIIFATITIVFAIFGI